MNTDTVSLLINIMFVCIISVRGSTKPHIVTIIADDMGWNDVGFHGSNQIPTPNIDALAYSGVILNRHYTMPSCTPSRTAFLTGKYPIRTGTQGYPLRPDEPWGLPLEEVVLPQRLKHLGYTTRLVGKWHQGSHKSEFTPTRRGFDSFLGYWSGFIDYFNHTYKSSQQGSLGHDFRRGACPTLDHAGRYATDAFTHEAEVAIRSHDTARPLYLQIAHLAVHSGSAEDPLQVPEVQATHDKFGYVSSPERRLYAGMVTELDKSVGRVVKALADRGMLNNSIILLVSDNGASTQGSVLANSGSNWPLRGMKFTAHEGGVRCVAAVWSSLFQDSGRVSNQLIHLTDWLPTLYSAAGGDVRDLGMLDGIDQWASLTNTTNGGPRTQILVNIDEVQNLEALIDGKWKVSRGDFKNGVSGGYYGENGLGPENPAYSVTEVVNSEVNQAIKMMLSESIHASELQHGVNESAVLELRFKSTIKCPQKLEDSNENNSTEPQVLCVDYCLYDIEVDPCEANNVAADNAETLEKLVGVLNRFRNESVPQLNKPSDPAADPALHNYTWVSWLDEQGSQSHTEQCIS